MNEITPPHEAHEQAEQVHGHSKPDNHTLRIVCIIAVLSGVLAMVDEEKEKSTSAFLSTQMNATDIWAQYQAKANRAESNQLQSTMMNVLALTSPGIKETPEFKKEQQAITDRIARLNSEEEGGKTQLQERAKHEEHRKDHELHQMHTYGTSTKGLHIAVILASLSLVIRKKWLPILSVCIGSVSAAWALLALLGIY